LPKLERLSIWDFKGAIAGLAAGLAGTILGHPLDAVKVHFPKHCSLINTDSKDLTCLSFVKTRLQTHSEYKGMLDCFNKIIRTEGVEIFIQCFIVPECDFVIVWS
jgi:hypothetical protein